MSAAAVIMMRTKRVFAYLRNRGAFSPETAIPASDVPYSDRWYFRRLVRFGAVRIHEEKYYLDECAAQQYLRCIRARALAIVGFVLLLVLICGLASLFH